jgi:predicted acyltransferase
VFRGLTVALMILVNSPGSWAHIHPPLRHASWHGLTPTDLVFPFFLFIVGAAVSLSFARRLEAGAATRDLVRKIVIRSVIIFLLGLFLNGFPFNTSPLTWRVPGVLQRIALCYLAAGLVVVLTRSNRNRALAAVGFVLGYELLMRLPLVPEWGAGSFALPDNFVRWVDLRLLGEAHMHRVGGMAFDSEGLLSTLPAVATTLAGFFVGEFIRGVRPLAGKLRRLALGGSAVAVAGFLMCVWEPVNKQLWTTSYVLVTGGMAVMTLALSSWMIDVRQWRAGTMPALVFGSNPLVAFVGSGLLARTVILIRVTDSHGATTSLQGWIYNTILVPAAGPVNGSLLYAALNVAFWLGLLWLLYRKRLFVKI